MSRNELAPKIGEDFDRILDHLAQHEVKAGPERIEEILAAIDVLARNPYIGRPLADGNRALIIGRGSRGYVALYRYVIEIDTVFVVAVRGQRESGYKRE